MPKKPFKPLYSVYTCNVQDPESSQKKTEEVFFDMINAYEDAIFRFLYFRVNDRATALDITQDTFTKTWLYLTRGNTIEYPEAFLYRAAKNALVDYYKKSKSSSLDSLMDAGYDPASFAVTDEVLRQDDIQTVRTILDTLDEDSKQIMFLRFAEEKPIEEIATLYGKSVNAMTVQIHRIVKKLRGRYTDSQIQ